jgi:hypothetical protein
LQWSVDPANAPLRAGEPFSLVVHLVGEGVTAAQLPEIALPAIPGAQVYPEPSSTVEHAHDGTIQSERARRFVIVADRAGNLKLPGLSLPWWDVVNDRAATAHLAMPGVQIAPGTSMANKGSTSSTPTDATDEPTAQGSSPPANATSLRTWQIASLVLAVLLILSLAWGWRRGRFHDFESTDEDGHAEAHTPRHAPALARALMLGDPAVIAQSLREAAPGELPSHLDEVARRLGDPTQKAAVQAFEAARWSANGTPAPQVMAQLREAFARPPRWIAAAGLSARKDVLPPLYPD